MAARKSRRDRPELDEYRRRRDPARTTEPFGPAPTRAGPTRQGDFVVHLHDARRRHYDLRLEVGGTLKSFAVPKGPSLRPADKRLAVQTEDHPLDYLDFEEVIPAGNYGAGAMITWDRGLVRYPEASAEEGLETGKVDFELFGQKLRGRFALVRTSGRKGASRREGEKPQWLLFKKTDAFADAERDIVAERPHSVLSGMTIEELPEADRLAAQAETHAAELGATEAEVDARRLTPMLCAPAGGDLQQPGWLYELKLDGVRILADRRGDDVSLWYRTRRPATATYPEIVRALRTMAPRRFVLDGEIVAFDETGRPSFQRLIRRIQASRPLDIRFVARAVPVVYVVFDVLVVGNRDARKLPLSARKTLLAELVRGAGYVRALDHVEDDGQPLYDFCRGHHLEGVVTKRADSPYQAGTRSNDWIKIKCDRDDDFVVVGYTRGKGARQRLGALDLASHEDGRLVLRGRVGSGLDQASIDALRARLEGLEVESCPAEGELEPAPRGETFVRPEVVVRVQYTGWTDEGSLRHPVFRGVRHDVAPEECVAAPEPRDVLAVAEPSARPRGETRSGGRRGVRLTNQDKVFWPDEGYTKGDLCEYYERIAAVILPYLRDRPVVLVRYPDGVGGKHFYQWNLPRDAPAWVRTVQVRSEERGKERSAFLVDDVDSLLYVANLGAIPLHVLAARASDLAQCDFLTLDFDVGEAQTEDAIRLVRTLRELLEEIGLPGFPKTSGQTGLHVLVPLGPGHSFDTARTLGELLGRLVVARHPDLGTMERRKDRRGGRVYVDTGQIGRSRTIVAPWSVRAHPGATVSTPLEWDEVGFALDPRRFTIQTAPERVRDRGDPMAPLLDARPDVEAAVARLGEQLGRA